MRRTTTSASAAGRLRLLAGLIAGVGALALTLAGPGLAQSPAAAGPSAQMPMDHSAHGAHPAPAPSGEAPSTAAFKAANEKMHAAMAVPYTGDADLDFVNGMIPHHEGAVEMAKIVLQYGKDPEIRRLAEAIVKAQDEEIAFMTAWRAKHGGAAPK